MGTTNKTTKTTRLEIFCGTGGVGKTTIAASRAVMLSRSSDVNRVLLITIDPSHRLKDVLAFPPDYRGGSVAILNDKLHGLLLRPDATIKRILNGPSSLYIIDILFRPFSGMNEIMSMVEIKEHIDSHQYDYIILDTPPGKHFVDFLSATNKIKHFFDQSFVDAFKYFKLKIIENVDSHWSDKVLNIGINKLLGYLEFVTGSDFVRDFIQTIYAIYSSREKFTDALAMTDLLKNPSVTKWYLVTAMDHNKIDELMEIKNAAHSYLTSDKVIILNKSLSKGIEQWLPIHPQLIQLKNSIITRENEITTEVAKHFNHVISIPEISSDNPAIQIESIIRSMNDFQ